MDNPNKLVVLSYNLCWGCLTNNDNDATAWELASFCRDNTPRGQKSVCLRNMANVFDRVKEQYGGLDLVATQETVDFKSLIQFSNILKQMNYVHSKVTTSFGFVEMGSLYNPERFELIAVKAGDIDFEEKGRPYQLLFLRDKQTNKNIVFINVHIGRNIKKLGEKRFEELSTKLTNNINNAFFTDKINSQLASKDSESDSYGVTVLPENQTDDITDFLKNNSFEVILGGDTNDQGKFLQLDLWKGFKPFEKYNGDSNIRDIVVKSNTRPPKTCCQTERRSIAREPALGDYIVISNGLEYIIENQIPIIEYNYRIYPTSDHIPIVSVIDYKNQEGASRKRLKKVNHKKSNKRNMKNKQNIKTRYYKNRLSQRMR